MITIGRFRYSPKMFNGGKQNYSTKWWLVVDCDPEIGRLYRELFTASTYRVHSLKRPAWEAHISVIRNEKPPKPDKWEAYKGKTAPIVYDPTKIEFNGTYAWIPVVCPAALEIREELGLPRDPYFPLHMTIGNCKD